MRIKFFDLVALCISLNWFYLFPLCGEVKVGCERLVEEEYASWIKGKKVGLITNHAAVTSRLEPTVTFLKKQAKKIGYTVTALFAPEHGITGAIPAEVAVADAKDADNIPIYSLYGKTKRPTAAMLKKVDILLYDLQDIGTRSYTYATTLFYVMEEAAKYKIPLIVLDRPNPINGLIVDGPMLEKKWRSDVGYIDVPYCHGMTIGELARLFNEEYHIGCALKVVPMRGWQRSMSFEETGLPWIPTSPQIPEPSTPLFYPMTGILGELQMVSIGVGYTLPFKVVGAPWIDGEKLAYHLNKQEFPGVYFYPYTFRPFFGRFKLQDCQGVFIAVTDKKKFLPVSTQYLLIGVLKSLYPQQFAEALKASEKRKDMFCKVNGTEEAYRLIAEEKNIVWKLRGLHAKERDRFKELRRRYLIADYSN